MQSQDFHIDWKEHYAVFTITREDKLNALSREVVDGLAYCLDEIEQRNYRGLIITGVGRAFSSGTDLGEAASLSMEEGQVKLEKTRQLFWRLYQSPITSIAAINGLAYGGGLELALACTFRVALADAKLALPEIKLAVLPAYGGTQFLPALIGRSQAADLMLTGRSVCGQEALSMGLLNRLIDQGGDVLPAAESLLQSVTCHSQVAIKELRRCLDGAGSVVTEAGLALEQRAAAIALASADAMEGLTAFLEKRQPNYRHQ